MDQRNYGQRSQWREFKLGCIFQPDRSVGLFSQHNNTSDRNRPFIGLKTLGLCFLLFMALMWIGAVWEGCYMVAKRRKGEILGTAFTFLVSFLFGTAFFHICTLDLPAGRNAWFIIAAHPDAYIIVLSIALWYRKSDSVGK